MTWMRRAGVVLGVWGLALGAALPVAAAPDRKGKEVEITGLVADPEGNPIADLHVVLEVTRQYFSFRRFGWEKTEPVRVTTRTDQRGIYTLHWPWDNHYNSFELLVGVPVRKPEGERLRVLQRVDVTQKVLRGGPVVASLVVDNTGFLNSLREFLANLKTEDERRIYQEMGKPDKVQLIRYPEHRETSWWYFEAGKMYRFRDGELEQVVHFDPVKAF